MTNETDNLVLEHLRAIRADMADMRSTMRDVKARLSSIESYIATLHGESTRASIRIDELQTRIETIEHRLGLVD